MKNLIIISALVCNCLPVTKNNITLVPSEYTMEHSKEFVTETTVQKMDDLYAETGLTSSKGIVKTLLINSHVFVKFTEYPPCDKEMCRVGKLDTVNNEIEVVINPDCDFNNSLVDMLTHILLSNILGPIDNNKDYDIDRLQDRWWIVATRIKAELTEEYCHE